MKKLSLLFPLLFLTLLLISPSPQVVWADDCDTKGVEGMNVDELSKLIDKCNRALQMSIAATRPHEETLNRLKGELFQIQKRVDWLENAFWQKEQEIKKKEIKLAGQEEILALRVRQFYIRSFYNPPFLVFLSQTTASNLTRELAYRKTVTDQDKKIITQIVLEIKDLEAKKESLAREKERLGKIKQNLANQAQELEKLVGGAKSYQTQLSQEIAGLSARQQQLLAEKLGGFTTSVGEVPLPDDPASSPTFDPGFRPAFAAFSFGAPHRVGMSQYGAFGRAKAGQNAEEILKAYFSGVEIKKDYPEPETIQVDGYGRLPFEDLYLKGIAEMPSLWGDEGGMEALKAQAVAARTYALAVTNNGQGSICASEACQVFIGQNKGGKWEEAVNQTRGWVILKDGQPIKAWYASTAGGFTRSSQDMWGKATSYTQGIKDVSPGGSWPTEAYEGQKFARSPWFYKAWYKRYRAPAATRPHPWLTNEEFSDILNALQLYQTDSSAISHLSQVDKGDGETWSQERVKEELRKRGLVPITRINNLPPPTYSNYGYTAQITLETEQGSKSFAGEVFRQIFNLRAPGELHLASSLYNLEKK